MCRMRRDWNHVTRRIVCLPVPQPDSTIILNSRLFPHVDKLVSTATVGRMVAQMTVQYENAFTGILSYKAGRQISHNLI